MNRRPNETILSAGLSTALGDCFIGCKNSIRYDGQYYDPKMEMFCTNTGSYYNIKEIKMVGDECYVDMKKLFWRSI